MSRADKKEDSKTSIKPEVKEEGAQAPGSKSRQDKSGLASRITVGFFTLNPDSVIIDANIAGADMLRIDPRKLLKQSFTQYVDPIDVSRWESHLAEVLKHGQKLSCTLLLRRKDRSTFSARLDSIHLGLNGKESAVRTIVADITVEKRVGEVYSSLELEKDKTLVDSISARYLDRGILKKNLEKERQEFKLIVDSIPIIVFYKDRAGKFIRVNRAFAEALKITQEEFLGKTVYDLYSPEIARAMTEDDQAVLQTGRPKLNIIEQYESATGPRWVQTDKIPILDETGFAVGLVGFAQDITDRLKMEEALRESEKRVKTKLDAILAPQGDIGELELPEILDIPAIQSIMDDFFKLTNVSAWILDLKGKILVSTGWRDICTRFHRVNSETCKNCVESDTQLSESVAPGTFKIYKCKNNMWDLVTPIVVGNKHIGNLFLGEFLFDDEAVDDALFRSQAKRYGFNEDEYLAALELVPRLSRQTIDTAMAFYSKFARMISTLSHSNIQLARSLTEKDQLLAALKESEEKYRTLFDQAPVGIALTTADGRVIELNNAQAVMMGYTVQELRGEKAVDYYIDPEKRKTIEEIVQKNGKLHDVEVELKKKDGSILIEILNFDRLQIAGSEFLLVTGQDVTGLREAEKAVRESEALYRLLAEHTTDFVWLMDMNLNPTYQSPSAERLTGFTREELATLPIEKRIAPDSLKAAADMFFVELPKVIEDPNYNPVRTLELEILCKDGSTLWSENKFSVIRDENGKAVSILGEAREITKRKQAEDALRESEAQYRLLAEHTTDTVGLMDKDLNTIYVSPSSEKVRGYTVQEIMTLPLDKHVTEESFKLAMEVIMRELPRVEAEPDYNPVIALELEYNRKDGTTLWMENKFSIIRDESGKFVNILAEARDITERREAAKKLEGTLAALEKTLNDTVIAISRIVEMKDPFTAGHQLRVAQLATAMAQKMNLTDEQTVILNTAATIHDIGKIYVPSDILSKPGKLNPLEYEIIQTHVRGSYEILKDINFTGPIAQIVYQHHERMDGSGYPLGLRAPDILPLAKILIVADVVEAMSSHRPYRAAMGINKAIEEITNNRGKLYDEAAVDACLELFRNNEFEFKSS